MGWGGGLHMLIFVGLIVIGCIMVMRWVVSLAVARIPPWSRFSRKVSIRREIPTGKPNSRPTRLHPPLTYSLSNTFRTLAARSCLENGFWIKATPSSSTP